MSADSVPIWPPTCYLQAVRAESSGRMATTHMALLISPQGTPCRGYVKHYPEPANRALFNEWFCHNLLHHLGLPQPGAALMHAPTVDGSAIGWAFVSLEASPVNAGTPKQVYDLNQAAQVHALVRRLMSCAAVPALVAADQLMANADRNMGNLVFTGKDTLLAIDHGNALHGPAWQPGQLCSTQRPVRSILLEVLRALPEGLQPKTMNLLVAAAEALQEAYYGKQDQMREAIDTLHRSQAAMAMDMTWWRCGDLGTWMRDELGVI